MSEEPSESVDPAVLARAAFETLVYAPIGLGAKLVDDAPDVARRVRQELSNARFIGRLTVEQGAARLSEQMPEPRRRDRAADREPDPEVIDVLPIAGYDELPAIEIVGMLDTLTSGQRDAIAEHESANRRRRTVLGKIAQLSQ